LRTKPVIKKSVRSRRVRSVSEYPGLTVTEADLDVKEQLLAVQEKKFDGTTVRQYMGHQGLPPHRLPTEGVCIEVKGELLRELDSTIETVERMAVYYAIERLLGSLFPVILGPCDAMDYDTFCERRDGALFLYLYDQVHDGIDLAVQAFGKVDQLLSKALERVRSCDCAVSEGCFRCVRNPDVADVTDKNACCLVLERILEQMRSHKPLSKTFNIDVLEESSETTHACPACQASVGQDDRFCSNCGEKMREPT
jgi:ATP-dependent helicase YprA (DUF1998 family)